MHLIYFLKCYTAPTHTVHSLSPVALLETGIYFCILTVLCTYNGEDKSHVSLLFCVSVLFSFKLMLGLSLLNITLLLLISLFLKQHLLTEAFI